MERRNLVGRSVLAASAAFLNMLFPEKARSESRQKNVEGYLGLERQHLLDGPEAFELRAHGFIGDGGSHPLSELFTTLADARVVYPHAQTLSDEVDWAAIQGLIDKKRLVPGYGLRIDYPTCLAVINRTIKSDGSPIEHVGKGADASRLLFACDDLDLFQHGLSRTPAYGATFKIRNMGLFVTGPGPRYAINIAQETNSGGFFLENVKIGSYSAKFSWKGFVRGRGNTNTSWRNVTMSGGEYNPLSEEGSATQIGVRFLSSDRSDHSFVYLFEDCQIGAVQHAFVFEVGGDTPGEHGTIEGVQFHRCGGRVDTGAWFKLTHAGAQTTGWYPPYFIWRDCNMEGSGTFIDADAISDFHIDNNLQFLGRNDVQDADVDLISIRRGLHGTICNSSFVACGATRIRSLIYIGSKSNGITIRDNIFSLTGTSTVTMAGIVNDKGNRNVKAVGNEYEGPAITGFATPEAWPVNISREANLSGLDYGNYFDKADEWVTFTPTVVCTRGRLGSALATAIFKRSGSLVTIFASINIHKNGDGAGVMEISLPIKSAEGFAGALYGFQVKARRIALTASINENAESIIISLYDGSYPGMDGVTLVISGSYKVIE